MIKREYGFGSEKWKESMRRRREKREKKIKDVIKRAIENEEFGIIEQVINELRKYPEFRDKEYSTLKKNLQN